MRAKRQNRSLYDYLSFLDKRGLTEWFFSLVLSGETVSRHSIEMFAQSSKSSNFGKQLESPLCVLTFLGTLFHNIKFFWFPLESYEVSTQQLGFFKQNFVFMGVETSIFTSLNISKNKFQNNFDFTIKFEHDFVPKLII